MNPKIYPIFSQDLDSGATGEFGIDDAGQAYWNGKPIVTQEKVVLQLWVSVAVIITALAVVGQLAFAGLTYFDSRHAAGKNEPAGHEVAENLVCLNFANEDDRSVFSSTGLVPAGASVSSKTGEDCKGIALAIQSSQLGWFAEPPGRERAFPVASGYACDTPGEMSYSTKEGTLACIAGKWKHSPDCTKDGLAGSARGVRLVCHAGKWTPPL